MLRFSSNGDNNVRLRMGLQIFANVLTVTGLCMILGAMFTSAWQIGYPENNSIYEHGLYRDCVRGQDNIRPADDWVCFWKFDQNNHIQTDRFYKLRDYQVSVLVILGVSCALAVATVICAYCTCCMNMCNIPWAILALLTAILAVIGIGIFGFNASISDNRFIRMYNYETDMYLGASFYIAIIGTIAHWVAAIVAGVCIGLTFMEMRKGGGGVIRGVPPNRIYQPNQQYISAANPNVLTVNHLLTSNGHKMTKV